jgi:hypothetical protein
MQHDRIRGAHGPHRSRAKGALRTLRLNDFVRARTCALLALAAVASGCAASPPRAPLIVLQSSAYQCSVEPGLGCGLELAPVLARLDQIEGVESSHASWDGRHFRIALRPAADEQHVARQAMALLDGSDVRRVESRWKRAELEDQRRWFDADETLELSRHEAGVLAAQQAAALSEEIALDAPSSAQLLALLRAVLLRAFEHAHAQGGGLHRLRACLLEARGGFEQRLDFLHPGQRARVAAYLDRQFAGMAPAESERVQPHAPSPQP